MAVFPNPPTWTPPFRKDESTGIEGIDPQWLQWFLDVAAVFTNGGLGTISHEALSNLLGGGSSGHWHLTSAQQSALTNGQGAAVTTPAIGTSPWTYQNTLGYPVYATYSGGAVTAVALSRNGTTFYGVGTQNAVLLAPGDSIKIAYTVAPSLAFFPQ